MRNFGTEKYARMAHGFIYESGSTSLPPSQVNKKSKRFNIQLHHEVHRSV